VIIGFLSTFGGGRTPVLDLAGHCNPSVVGGCTSLLLDIQSCQAQGVSLLLGIGGAGGNYSLSSASDAKSVATYLWDNFLGGDSSSSSLSLRVRPFSSAVLDGIDFSTSRLVSHLDDLAKSLKSLGGGTLVLTAAPQCPYPDASLGAALATGLFDYVWVQFYNNPRCDYQQSGDVSTLRASWNKWTQFLPSASVFLGLPASQDAAASGYIDPKAFVSRVLPVVDGSANFGGVMLWNRYYDNNTGYSAKLIFLSNSK
jgi:chitinase